MFLMKNRQVDSTTKSTKNTKFCRRGVRMKMHTEADMLSYKVEKQSPMASCSSFLRGGKNEEETLSYRKDSDTTFQAASCMALPSASGTSFGTGRPTGESPINTA